MSKLDSNLSALLTPHPLILFTTEEITDCTKEVAKGANKVPRNPTSFFFFFLFHVSLFK